MFITLKQLLFLLTIFTLFPNNIQIIQQRQNIILLKKEPTSRMVHIKFIKIAIDHVEFLHFAEK